MELDPRFAIIVSAPYSRNLSIDQRRFLKALLNRVENSRFRILHDAGISDTLQHRLAEARHCHGCIVLAFSQWQAERLYRSQARTAVMPSEFSHINALMAVAAKRPLLVLREKTVGERGSLRSGYLPRVLKLPTSLNPKWLESTEFDREFRQWAEEVQRCCHVFLGYSSQATVVADKIRDFLTDTLKLRVLDWHEFDAGVAIWESIEKAEESTNCGLFLFMTDDKLTTGTKREFAPRDNVVYEAGYFAGAKGRRHSLIIREKGAKVPTDLGGILYLELENRDDITPLKGRLRRYLEGIFSS